jgi:hypothetical protein
VTYFNIGSPSWNTRGKTEKNPQENVNVVAATQPSSALIFDSSKQGDMNALTVFKQGSVEEYKWHNGL